MDGSSPLMGSGSPLPELLTPRSKVAKMLADIDAEIENAPSPTPSRKPAPKPSESSVDTSEVSPSTTRPSPAQSQDNPDLPKAQNDPQSDDSEDEIVRPKGRTAGRMFMQKNPSARTQSSPAGNASPMPLRPLSYHEDDDDLYSATPMKQIRQLRSTSPSSVGSVRSKGLFVSPTRPMGSDDEDDLQPHRPGGNDKLTALIAQKRTERLTKEAEEKARSSSTTTSANPSSDLPEEAFEGPQEPVDPNVERIMSDATRPSRSASKKALLEMERETQRMARQQALAHQMKVKKKFTTDDLFAKFNFRQSNVTAVAPTEELAGDTTASSVPNSDGIEERSKEPASTPPSSPPTPLDRQKELVEQGALSKLVPVRQDSIASLAEVDDDEELLDISEIMKSSQAGKKVQPANIE